MAWTTPKTFAAGERLFASDLNTYVSDNLTDLDTRADDIDGRTVKTFADASARTSGITSPTEGMLSYLADTDAVEVYDGSAWTAVGGGGFTASTTITATDASWSVPTLADPIVRVTVIAGGGGGGGAATNNGANGNSSTFACSAGTATASGGAGGDHGSDTRVVGNSGVDDRLTNANGGNGGHGIGAGYGSNFGEDGLGGGITVAYLDLTGISTASVTCGAGGAGGVSGGDANGGDGGDGFVIVEYRAG